MKAIHKTHQVLVTSASNLLPFIDYCDQQGLEWRSSAKECGLPIEMLIPDQWLPTNDVMRFLHKLDVRYGDKIGFDVVGKATLSILSPGLKLRLLNITSLEQAIQVLLDEISTLSNHVTIWVEYRDHSWWLCHRSCYRPQNLGFELAEWFRTQALIHFCQQLLGEDWNPNESKLVSSNSRNRNLPPRFGQITLDCEYGAIQVPLDTHYRPLQVDVAKPDWFESVSTLIASYSCLPWFNIDWFAEALGMTRRTLQRNLKARGLVFKQIKEQARLNKATELLASTDLSVAEISWQVGYTDLSNFNRAFKKQVGMTAPNYRKSLLSI
ncbi:transcriptional regulator AraC family [Vibrio variabilis]|uniref:Transcriptional regulator AraC family n=1 Tax=Vibrio variabilis TaxID=990271 RepID=A0ABQ0JGD3_9VIBR|nr:transcriptional regulator AraC family [Vibrio variabilis]